MAIQAIPSATPLEGRLSRQALAAWLVLLCFVAVIPWSVFFTPLFVLVGVRMAEGTRSSIVPAGLVGLAYAASRMAGLLLPEWIWDASALSPLRDPVLLLVRSCAEAMLTSLAIGVLGGLVRQRGASSLAA